MEDPLARVRLSARTGAGQAGFVKSFPLTCLVLATVWFAACEAEEPNPPVSTPPEASLGSAPAMEATEVQSLHGVVREVLAAGHYTYVRVDTQWAVVFGEVSAVPGHEITLRVQGSQDDFHSRRLDRDFERLFFAST